MPDDVVTNPQGGVMASNDANVGAVRNKLGLLHNAFSIVFLQDANIPDTEVSGVNLPASCGIDKFNDTGLFKRTKKASSFPTRIR